MVRAGERRIKQMIKLRKEEGNGTRTGVQTHRENFHNKREKKQPSSKFLDNVFLKVLLINVLLLFPSIKTFFRIF